MKNRKRWAVGLALALALAASVVAGWAIVSREDPGRLTIRVETIRDEDGAFHRRWTFAGARRWESYGAGTRGGDHFVVLDPPGARDGGAVRFLKGVLGRGADRLVYDFEAVRSPSGPASGPVEVAITRTLRGNAGGTPSFSSSTVMRWPGGPWASEFREVLVEDARVAVPSKVRLGVFGGSAEEIEFR